MILNIFSLDYLLPTYTSFTNTLPTPPLSFQLRYLQTLNSIAAENNSTIIFPIPIDIVAHFIGPGGQDPTQQLQAPAPTHQVVCNTLFAMFLPGI